MEIAYLIETIIKVVVILTIFSALAGIGTYFERKILAFMQRRLGPMNVGPFGLLQVAADGVKLFTKEDIIPTNVVAPIFKIAPVITASTAFMAAAAIPFLPQFDIFGYTVHPIVADINIGILYILGIMGVGLYEDESGGDNNGKYGRLVVIDSEGNTSTDKVYEIKGEFDSVTVNSKGNLIMAGIWNGDVIYENAWILEADITGEIIWESRIQLEHCKTFSDVVVAHDGGYIAVGNGGAKFSKTGELIWEYSHYHFEGQMKAIMKTEDGNYITSGNSNYVTKFDENGYYSKED